MKSNKKISDNRIASIEISPIFIFGIRTDPAGNCGGPPQWWHHWLFYKWESLHLDGKSFKFDRCSQSLAVLSKLDSDMCWALNPRLSPKSCQKAFRICSHSLLFLVIAMHWICIGMLSVTNPLGYIYAISIWFSWDCNLTFSFSEKAFTAAKERRQLVKIVIGRSDSWWAVCEHSSFCTTSYPHVNLCQSFSRKASSFWKLFHSDDILGPYIQYSTDLLMGQFQIPEIVELSGNHWETANSFLIAFS